eukprot:PhF_6_TR7975/c0_g1_i1/m.12154
MGCCCSASRPVTKSPQDDAFSTVIVTSGLNPTNVGPHTRPSGGRRTHKVQKSPNQSSLCETPHNGDSPPAISPTPSTLNPTNFVAQDSVLSCSGSNQSTEHSVSNEESGERLEEDPGIFQDALDIVTLISRADSQTKLIWEGMIIPMEYRGKMNRKKLREWIDEVGKLPRPVMVLIKEATTGTQLSAATLSQNHKMLVNMEQRLRANRAPGSTCSESTDSRRYSNVNVNKIQPDYNLENEQPINFIEELMEEERRFSDVGGIRNSRLPASPHQEKEKHRRRRQQDDDDDEDSTSGADMEDSDFDVVENGSAISS